MRKHTLLIHHLEEQWRTGLERFGLSPESMALNIIDFLHSPKGRHINDVIFTRFEDHLPCDTQHPIIDYLKGRGIAHTHHVFGYGEVEEMFEGLDCTLVEATRNDAYPGQVVYIDDWHKELKFCQTVLLCGAFEGECIQDAEDMLAHVRGVDGYKKLDELIAGSHEVYTPHFDPVVYLAKGNKLIRTCEMNLEKGHSFVTVIKRFERDVGRLCSDPGFQIFAKYFQSEDIGDLHSENDEINSKLESAISCIDLNALHRERDDLVQFSY
jgi:hypothetical protein